MDKLKFYRQTIEQVLQEYAAIPYSIGEIETRTVFDRERDQYLLVAVGWNKDRREHDCVVHLEIINGKIWIQEDNTEYGIAADLERTGIEKDEIVLGFRHPALRSFTEYAAA